MKRQSMATQAARTEFLFSNEKEPHRARTREILKKYPEIRKLIGVRNPWSFLIILLSVGVHTAAAIAAAHLSWWIVVLTAFFVGTIFNEIFIALVHDASHNLVFRKKSLNKVAGLIVNAPMFIPSFISFQKYHMKHHAFQGVYELDADLPAHWEAKWVVNIWWRKLLWLVFYPLIQTIRTARVKEVAFFDSWVILNWVVTMSFSVAIYYFFGFKSLAYIAISFWFAFGLSIVGGRLIQEHYMTNEPQETYSYYGILNIPCLNIAYHNEHHDFPSAPWNKLPQIKKIAPEYYESLAYHTSWTKLILKFIFDKKMSVMNRVERNERGGIALNAEVRPDIDIARVKAEGKAQKGKQPELELHRA